MTYDLIDKIYTPTGVTLTDSDGFEYPEMIEINGYHVNMLEVTEATQPFVVQVNTPSRKFAGRDDTIHLRFVDRAEWLSIGIEVEEETI